MKKRIAALILTMMMLFAAAFGSTVLAEGEDKNKEPEAVTLYYTSGADSTATAEIVASIQQVLLKLGYYQEGENIKLGYMDSVDLNALSRFFKVNNIQWDPNEGVSPEHQNLILHGSPVPNPTEAPVTPSPTPDNQPTPFPTVLRDQTNDEIIGQIQMILSKAGYYYGIDTPYTPGVFDEPTEEAVKRFFEQFGAAYDESKGITWIIYNTITTQGDKIAVFNTPSPTPFNFIEYSTNSEEVRAIQTRLKELGYFRDSGDPPWGQFEEVTLGAVSRFCKVHNIPENQYGGMDAAFYNRLMSDQAKENPVDRQDFHKEDKNEDIRGIQERLFGLGYYKDRERTGVYDDDMDAALNDFKEVNHINYDGATLPVALQDAILNENALPLPADWHAANETPSNFLTDPVRFLGIGMPMYLLILLIVIILAGLAFLVIRVFSSGKGDKNEAAGSYNLGGNASSSGRKINLDIRYHGDIRQETVSMDKPLRIGRSERTLPLNPGDSDISRQHCQISFRGDTLILRDYSTNGTEVNHQMYHNCECVIHSGDTVKIGNHEITVRY